MKPTRGGGTVSTRSGGGAISMSMATPADAIVGTATALAAMHKPKNNALREAFIHYSFFDVVRSQRNQTYCLNGTGICSVDPQGTYVGRYRIPARPFNR
jgi:hypothetical protein